MTATLTLSEDTLQRVAPDSDSLQAARGLLKKNSFLDPGISGDQTWLLGRCKGSGKQPYEVSVDLGDPSSPTCRCNCPSRKFPCKHGLGLMLPYLQSPDKFAAREPSPELLAKREKKAVRDQKKAEGGEAVPRKVNKAALAKKAVAQRDGLDLLEKLVLDLVSGGQWFECTRLDKLERQAKQLNDAYLPGATYVLNRNVFAGRKDVHPALMLKTLLSLAHHTEAAIRHEVVGDVAKLGPDVKEVVPTLIEAAGDADVEVAVAAVVALSGFPPDKREAAIPALMERAAHPKANEDVVSGIIDILPEHVNRFGDKILGLLRQMLKGKNDYVRGNAVDALAKIGPPARKLLPEILEQVNAGSGGLTCDEVFVKLEPEGTTSIPALIALLSQKKSLIRVYAMEGLTGYGPKAQAAEPLVTKLLKDRDWWVKYKAQTALAAIKGES
jgi:hypothetical protein